MSECHNSKSSSSAPAFSLSQVIKQAYAEYTEKELSAHSRVHSQFYKHSMSKKRELSSELYALPEKRAAYVRVYVQTHSLFTAHALSLVPDLVRLINDRCVINKTLTVASIGGGPGSDILGIIRFIETENRGFPSRIVCNIVDRDEDWGVTWNQVFTGIELTSIGTSYFRMDISKPEQTSPYRMKLFRDADIITMIKLASEVYDANGDEPIAFYGSLFDTIKVGAFVVVVENACPKWKIDDKFTRQIRQAAANRNNISLLFSANNESVDQNRYRSDIDETDAAIKSSQESPEEAEMHHPKSVTPFAVWIYKKVDSATKKEEE